MESLNSRIQALTKLAERWNNAYLGFVILAVLVGAFTVYAQYKAIQRGRELSYAQGHLIREKELQVTLDLKDKELKIQEARVQAATAEEHAGNANERAGKAEAHLAGANARASEANARAKEAEARVASADAASKEAVARVVSAEARIAEANRAAAEANRVAESERLARLQLEARLADRVLTAEQQTRLTALLTPFPKTEVNVVIFGDTPEIGIISGVILDCLRRAGWIVHTANAGPGITVRGVLIGVRPDADGATINASRTLISGLQSMGIASGPWDFDQMPYPGVTMNSSLTEKAPMKIFVGSKP